FSDKKFGAPGALYSVSFSPDGKRFAVSGFHKRACVCDASSGKELFSLVGHAGPVSSIRYSTDGKWIISCDERSVRRWAAADGKELVVTSPANHLSFAVSAEATPDGRSLISASRDGTVIGWDVANREERFTQKPKGYGLNRAVLTPDGQKLAT